MISRKRFFMSFSLIFALAGVASSASDSSCGLGSIPTLIRSISESQQADATEKKAIVGMLQVGRFKSFESQDRYLLGNEKIGGVLFRCSNGRLELLDYGSHLCLDFTAIRGLKRVLFYADSYFVDYGAYPDAGTFQQILRTSLKDEGLSDLEASFSVSSEHNGKSAMLLTFDRLDKIPLTGDDIYILEGALFF